MLRSEFVLISLHFNRKRFMREDVELGIEGR